MAVLVVVFEEVLRASALADVGAALFAAAITLAALMVPAATLVRDHVLGVQTYLKQRVIAPSDNPTLQELAERKTSNLTGLDEWQSVVDPLLRSFAYIVAAVPVSALALVHPHLGLGQWPTRHHAVTLENLLAGLATALLVSAVWSSYPMTWLMLRSENVAALKVAITRRPTSSLSPKDAAPQPEAVTERSDSSAHLPHVVVHPVDVELGGRPFRRVDILGQAVGRAYNATDVEEYMRHAGLDTALFHEPGTAEWRGGGPEEWEWHTPT